MKITDIQAQKKNENRFSIFVEGEYSFSLSLEEIDEYKVRVGNEIDERELDRLKKVSEDGKLLGLTISKALRRRHSEKELRDYLRTKRVSEELIEKIFQRLRKLKLVDDVEFARFWTEMRLKSGKSKRYIEQELRQKGVEPVIDVEKNMERESLRKMIEKKSKRYDDENKLIQYLMRAGFRYEDIKNELNDLGA